MERGPAEGLNQLFQAKKHSGFVSQRDSHSYRLFNMAVGISSVLCGFIVVDCVTDMIPVVLRLEKHKKVQFKWCGVVLNGDDIK